MLIPFNNDLITAPQSSTEDNAIAVANSTLYFPRIKLCQGNANEVKRGHVAKGGNFALITGKDEVEDLGDEIEFVVCTGRSKALRTGDVIMSIFDPKDPEFAKIKEESKDKDSGSMYGPEYLVFLPDVGDEGTFATLFLSNPTMRREGKSIHARLRKACSARSHLIDPPGSKHSWFGPLFGDCATPPTNLPDQDVFTENIDRFNNEKPSQMSTVDSEDDSGRDR